MPSRSISLILTVPCLALLLAGCSGSQPKAENVTSAPPVATATQGSTAAATETPTTSATEAPTPQPAATGENVKAYVDAVAAFSDPDSMRAGLKLAAPNSPAYVYLSHLANASEASLDGGTTETDLNVTSTAADSFKACSDPTDDKSCITLAGFKVDPQNRVMDLTVNGKAIAPRLTVGNGDSVKASGAKFTFLTAYKSVQSNALFVMVKVKTGSKAISPNLYSATYRSPSGKQRSAQEALGPIEIDADSNTVVGMVFPGVEPGGRVKLDGCVGDCTSTFTAFIKVG